MTYNLNYISSLPDFLSMQRVSFCWFITQGLTDELALFSKISDFGQNIEYFVFGEEYSLIKPAYSLLVARKYNGNYRAQLAIPIEIRNPVLNTTNYQSQFPIVTLPLMTTYATFIINGCERVIVSQIIRSPGIYFERKKNQKASILFKRKLPANITKLRAFVPAGDAFLAETHLFFSCPTLMSTTTKKKNKLILNWKRNPLYYYSLKSLKQNKKLTPFYFIQYLKIYQTVLRSRKRLEKPKMIYLFLQWLKTQVSLTHPLSENRNVYKLLTYFNFILQLVVKSNFLRSSLIKNPNTNSEPQTIQNIEQQELTKLSKIYESTIFSSQININLILNAFFISLSHKPQNWFCELSQFLVLRENSAEATSGTKYFSTVLKLKKFRPVVFFSNSFKEKFKYIFVTPQKKKKKEIIPESIHGPHHTVKSHKYLKTKAQILTYKNDHSIRTSYHRKYENKDLYTAILIPEYGSWVRIGFQKTTNINPYKYPIKNQEDEVVIQLDKVNQKPILQLLKEIGLTDKEINKQLEYGDFFYFTNPLLLNSRYFRQPLSRLPFTASSLNNISEFSRIFNPLYYRLGRLGRLKINKRLNIQISDRLQAVTYDDIFAIIDKLINLTISKTLPDDIDHLKNRRVRSIGELLQNLVRVGFQRLVRKLRNQTTNIEASYVINFTLLNATVQEFFGSSQLSQYLDQTNPLSSLTHRRRISGLGPGGFDRDRISFAVRDIHPSHYGRICPIETPEGQNVGLIASLTTCARVNKLGFLETPFWRVINGKIIKTGNPIYLTAELEDFYKIAPADLATNNKNYVLKNTIPVRYKQDFISVQPSQIDFIAISTIQVVSIAASLIPFFEHDDANRALMGSNMQRQSVPLMFPQKPIVGTGLENQIATDSGLAITSQTSGRVTTVTATKIIIQDGKNHTRSYQLQKYLRSNQQTCINYQPIVWKGEKVQSGQILTDGPAIVNNELALGQNTLIAYMPWQGYNFEDAILINERLIYDNVFTSIHIERYKIEIDQTFETSEQITKSIPNLSPNETRFLNNDGIIMVGTFAQPGNILVGKIKSNNTSEQLPESKLLRAIFGAKAKGVQDSSYRMPIGDYGRVIETITFNRKTKSTYKFEKIYIFIAQIRKIKVGDKIAGRHGNKGIISRILPRQDMPFLPDGTPIDIVLNPLGVPSRMNVGQLYECLLGLAGDKLNSRFKILPFDEMYGLEMSRVLINKKLRQASIKKNEGWLFNPYAPGKMVLMDGRTGQEFENPITVGNAYMLKLIHLVDDKMHARATGPYSLITQQPLRGKAQHGGQRFGEMEVWALEGFGASFTLQELLTVKSDDMQGRNETLSAIVKGKPMPKFGVPESFKVLLQELRSIGLDLSTYKIQRFSFDKPYEVEINLIEKYTTSSKFFFQYQI